MLFPENVGTPHPISTLAALGVVFLSSALASAADQPPSARATAPRTNTAKTTGPTPMIKRGLVVPPNLIDLYVGPFVDRPVGVSIPREGTTLGLIWGIVPELQVDLQLGPIYLNSVSGTSRFTVLGRIVKTKPLDVGLGVVTTFDPSQPGYIGVVQPGIPAIVRVNGIRIDTGLLVPMFPATDPHVGLRVPVSVYWQLTPRIHLGWTGSYFVSDLRDPGKTTTIPFGLTGGYSAGPELEFLAITPYFTWVNFYTPASGGLDTRSFIAGVIADVPFQLP